MLSVSRTRACVPQKIARNLPLSLERGTLRACSGDTYATCLPRPGVSSCIDAVERGHAGPLLHRTCANGCRARGVLYPCRVVSCRTRQAKTAYRQKLPIKPTGDEARHRPRLPAQEKRQQPRAERESEGKQNSARQAEPRAHAPPKHAPRANSAHHKPRPSEATTPATPDTDVNETRRAHDKSETTRTERASQ